MFTNQQIKIMVDALKKQLDVEHHILVDAAKAQDWEKIKIQEQRIRDINESMIILENMMDVPPNENKKNKTEIAIQYVTKLIKQNKDYTVRGVAAEIGCAISTAHEAINRAKQNIRL